VANRDVRGYWPAFPYILFHLLIGFHSQIIYTLARCVSQIRTYLHVRFTDY